MPFAGTECHVMAYSNLPNNRPFPSCLLPLFQTESKCEIFHMKMSMICIRMDLWVKLIFTWKVSHLDSFWNRGKRQLGNGLFHFQKFITQYKPTYHVMRLWKPRGLFVTPRMVKKFVGVGVYLKIHFSIIWVTFYSCFRLVPACNIVALFRVFPF